MTRPRAASRASLSSCCHGGSRDAAGHKDLLPHHESRDRSPPPPPPAQNCQCYENANFRPEGAQLSGVDLALKGSNMGSRLDFSWNKLGENRGT